LHFKGINIYPNLMLFELLGWWPFGTESTHIRENDGSLCGQAIGEESF